MTLFDVDVLRGALRRMALGSVSSSLLRSAPCPVTVVRPAGEPH